MKKRYISPTTEVYENAIHLPLLQSSITVRSYNQEETWYGTQEQ
jgi:hypothetical protein